ncbi:MAG: hypothetical protein AAGA80_24045 [Cyanobacteria bacterium P01_F01_bin.143]
MSQVKLLSCRIRNNRSDRTGFFKQFKKRSHLSHPFINLRQ